MKTCSHTPVFTLWQVNDYKERNNFFLRTTFWKCFVPLTTCVWKVLHKNWTLQWQKLYQNVIHETVAPNDLARSCIVTLSNAALFSIKIILCKTTNIRFSKDFWKPDKMNARFWKNKIGKISLDSFRNFAYVSRCLHLNFAWKRDCSISSNLQTSRSWSRSF